MVAEPSRKGDMYSYGILVLEIFTGRKPTDEMFKDGFNLHNFVKIALPDGLEQIVDWSILFRALEEEESHSKCEDIEIDEEDKSIDSENPRQMSTNLRKCLVSVLTIGLACSEDSPKERKNIGDVTRELERIRNAYIGYETRDETKSHLITKR
ncbi:Protein kinase-like domain containing protein [Parasponia andersonii]|uniref:Protein kinase-like domain containing protein n=1 Tax=Parasponia andersonii TaxID=3476 RepID=A0A2P5D6V2_PARAD|nr:Protein kinase-like domain containing protein [Parasponia andersonii]